MAALAVGVVGDEVEGADARAARSWCSGALAQREVVLLEVGVDEQLERALAVRPVALEVGGTRPQPSASDRW